jgi:tetratricopeptide (TPR) repeat protein
MKGRLPLWNATLFALFLIKPPLTWSQTAADRSLALAEKLFQQGDSKGAEKILVSAEKANPRSFLIHNNLGAIYLQQRRYANAIQEFSAASTLEPDNAEVSRNLGTSYLLSGDYPRAVEPLRRAKSLNSSDIRTRYQLGYTLLLLNRESEALPELEYVHNAMPTDPSTLFSLVKLYQALGDGDNAGKAFTALQQSHPDSALVHILLGESYDIQEKWQAAISEYRKALQQASTTPRLHFDLGFLYWESRQYPESVAEFKKELEINHGFAPALFYLGDIALNDNHPGEALKFFEQASASNPDCLEPRLGQGKALLRLDRPKEAAQQFEQAARVDAQQPDVYYWMATAYRRLQDDAKAHGAMARFQALSKEKASTDTSHKPGRWSNPACEASWGVITPLRQP